MLLPLLLGLAVLTTPVLPANILVILPFPGYSHVMPFMPIFKELGERGHSLTLLTTFEQTPNPKGFTQINVNLTKQDMKDLMAKMGVKDFSSFKSLSIVRGPMFQLLGLAPICSGLSGLVLERTKPLLPPPGTKFDLVFLEPFFCMETLVAASSLYNAPIVATLPMPLSPSVATVVGNPHGFSYVPNSRLPYTGEMCFLERVWNTIVNLSELLINSLYYLPQQDKLMREFLEQPELPYIGDLLQNISLLLTETHFSLNYPRPYMRNVVEVGGISLKIAKPLPKDLETFMNEATDGVIFFSWGSHFEATDVEETLAVMMKTFAKLKQRVLFKWHTEVPNVPSNVLIQKWVPQPSVLAHKNTVLFISHGGLNSVYEAAYHGVPVLGTPMFGDQMYNIRILEAIGMGIGIDPLVIHDGVTFPKALQRILNDPSFREKGREERELMRDRPQDVTKEAVYWIEYVLKHGGARLQPSVKHMPWYSVALLDVFLFLFFLLILAVSLLSAVVRTCLRLCRAKPQKPVSQKKKKQ